MFSNYILIAADGEHFSGRKVAASRVAESRLNEGLWPLYPRTQNRRTIAAGDRVLIYAAGHMKEEFSQCFIASARVEAIRPPSDKAKRRFETILITDIPVAEVRLDDVILFYQPVSIYGIRDRLSFVPAHKKWGSVMQGGCKRISDSDYEIVIQGTTGAA